MSFHHSRGLHRRYPQRYSSRLYSYPPQYLPSHWALPPNRLPFHPTISVFIDSRSPTPQDPNPGVRLVSDLEPLRQFQGILNVAAVVVDISDFGSLAGLTAIGYHNLMREKSNNRRKRYNQKCKRSGKSEAREDSSVDNSCGGDFTEASDGGESTTSTSSAASAAASPRILREMNGQELSQTEFRGGGILCWLILPRKIHISPSDENFRVLCSSQQKEQRNAKEELVVPSRVFASNSVDSGTKLGGSLNPGDGEGLVEAWYEP